jgi:RNA polymerase-binding transcription factor DksA
MRLDPATVRTRLHERRRQLVARYRDAVQRVDEELDSREIEREENASELWDARFLQAMGNGDAQAFRDVIAALKRLDEGSYGVCIECGEPIDEARLAAIPEASLCIADAEKKQAAGRKAAPLA